jgi:hypothetical protein
VTLQPEFRSLTAPQRTSPPLTHCVSLLGLIIVFVLVVAMVLCECQSSDWPVSPPLSADDAAEILSPFS